MDADITAANEMEGVTVWIRRMGQTLGRTGLYHLNHPVVKRSLEEAHEGLNLILQKRSELTLQIADNHLLVNGIVAEGIGGLEAGFIALFERFHLQSLTFVPGIPLQDFTVLFEILNRRPDPQEEEISQQLSHRGVRHVQCNTAVYIKVGEHEAVDPAPEVPGGKGGEVDGEERAWLSRVEQMSLEMALLTVIKRAVKDKEHQQKIFQQVMDQIQKELENKVKEATSQLEQEKQEVTFEKERSEGVVATAAEGMVVVDDQGRIVMMNPAAEKIYGATLKTIVGRDVREGIGEDRMVILSNVLSSAFTGQGAPEAEVRSDPATQKTLQAGMALIKNQDGKVVGMVTALSNVVKVREVEQMKRDFVASVTHELRTPLASVKQALALILDKSAGAVAPEQEKMLSLAQRNVERLNRLINDILDLSKLEAGKMVLNRDIHDLSEMVEEVGQTMALFARSRDVQLTWQAPRNLPAVFADRDRVIQILTNLAGNAVKFTPSKGKVTLTIPDVRPGMEQVSHLKVAVADTGHGIEKEDLSRIFEKFVQVSGKAGDVKGTGLGLTITKVLVEQHGGRIWVESEPGKGSKFTVSLPVYRENKTVQQKETRLSWWRLFLKWKNGSEQKAA
ncbi:MAG: PAS domain S-box protein [Nitrospirae bacterium]|nr:PAS domain S-box protein [Nitrospirota bacterium]